MTLFNRFNKNQSQTIHNVPSLLQLPFHAPNRWYKYTHFSLIIPNLTAPLHYLNLRVAMGESDIPIFKNNIDPQYPCFDRVSLLSSISPHMLGQNHYFSLQQDCFIQQDLYQFGDQVLLKGQFPEFQLRQKNDELSFDLIIRTSPIVSYPIKKIFGFYKYWSVLSQCEGDVMFKGQRYAIANIGSLEYSRSVNFPYLALCFYSYQVIQLKDQRQILLVHIRNHFNQVVQSKILIQDLALNTTHYFERCVFFKVLRVYPVVKTPDHRAMYLAREFEWRFSDGSRQIYIHGICRGDYKYGLGAGFVGSFSYHVQIDDHVEDGDAGYCEYIDCRPLRWQSIDECEKKLALIEQALPIALRNEKKFRQKKK